MSDWNSVADVSHWQRDQLEDKYYRLYEDNIALKKDKHTIADSNKLLTTRLRRLMSAAKISDNSVNAGDEYDAPSEDANRSNTGTYFIEMVSGGNPAKSGIFRNIRCDMPVHGGVCLPDNKRTSRALSLSAGAGKIGTGPVSNRRHRLGSDHAVPLKHADQRQSVQIRPDIALVRSENEQLKRQLYSAEKAADVLTEQNKQTEQEVETLKDQIDHIQAEHETQMNEMNRQLELAGKSRLSGNVDLIKLQRQLKQVNLQLQRSANRLNLTEQQLDEERRVNHTLKQQNAESSSRADELQLKLDQMKLESESELNQLKQQLQRQQLTCHDLQEDNKLLRNANEKLTSAVSHHADVLSDQNQLKQLQLALDSERSKLVAMETALHSEQHRNRLLADQLANEQQRSWRQQHELMSRINISDSRESAVAAVTSRQLVNVGTQTDADKTMSDLSFDKDLSQNATSQNKSPLLSPLRTEIAALASGDAGDDSCGLSATNARKLDPSGNHTELFNEIDTGEQAITQLTSLHSRYVTLVQQLNKSRDLSAVHAQIRTQLQTEVDVLNTRLTDLSDIWREKEQNFQQSLANKDSQIADLQKQVRGLGLVSTQTLQPSPAGNSGIREQSSASVSRLLALPHHCTNLFLYIDALMLETTSGAFRGGVCYLALTMDSQPPIFSRSLCVADSVQTLAFHCSYLINLQREASSHNLPHNESLKIEIFHSLVDREKSQADDPSTGSKRSVLSEPDPSTGQKGSDESVNGESTGTLLGSVDIPLNEYLQFYSDKGMRTAEFEGVGTLHYRLMLDLSSCQLEETASEVIGSSLDQSASRVADLKTHSEKVPQPASRRLPVVTSSPNDVTDDRPRPLPRQLPIQPISSDVTPARTLIGTTQPISSGSRLPVSTARSLIGRRGEAAQPIKSGYETYTESSGSDGVELTSITDAVIVENSNNDGIYQQLADNTDVATSRLRRRGSFVITSRPYSPSSSVAADVFNRPVISTSGSDARLSECVQLPAEPHSPISHSSHNSDAGVIYNAKSQTRNERDRGLIAQDECETSRHIVVCAEVHNSSSPDVHQMATGCNGSVGSVASDSEGVVVCRPAFNQQGTSLTITVAWLMFGSAVDYLRESSLEMRPLVFVEYRFLDLPPEELESPISLPLSDADKKMAFNFRKTISLDSDRNSERCRLLAEMLHKDNVIHSTGIVFSAVAEPPDTVQNDEAQCVDIGSAFVSLRDVVDSDVGCSAELQLDVRSLDGSVIGCMCVCLEGVDIVRSIAEH